jgi:DNA-binding transcriptional regulator YiaG
MTRDVFLALLEAGRARRRRRLDRLARSMVRVPVRAAARAASSEVLDVKAIRALTRLSQPKFAELLGIELSTLRNWEQGRRSPTGPAQALLRAIRNDTLAVVKALSH